VVGELRRGNSSSSRGVLVETMVVVVVRRRAPGLVGWAMRTRDGILNVRESMWLRGG
jgi:hypothetical protein